MNEAAKALSPPSHAVFERAMQDYGLLMDRNKVLEQQLSQEKDDNIQLRLTLENKTAELDRVVRDCELDKMAMQAEVQRSRTMMEAAVARVVELETSCRVVASTIVNLKLDKSSFIADATEAGKLAAVAHAVRSRQSAQIEERVEHMETQLRQ